MQLALAIGAIAGAAAVGTGAFGAHALKARLTPQALGWWETAVQYHFVHALALVGVGILLLQGARSGWLSVSVWGLVVGLVLFSGSLYAMSLGAPKWFGAITPIGGLAWIVAWLALAGFAFQGR